MADFVHDYLPRDNELVETPRGSEVYRTAFVNGDIVAVGVIGGGWLSHGNLQHFGWRLFEGTVSTTVSRTPADSPVEVAE